MAEDLRISEDVRCSSSQRRQPRKFGQTCIEFFISRTTWKVSLVPNRKNLFYAVMPKPEKLLDQVQRIHEEIVKHQLDRPGIIYALRRDTELLATHLRDLDFPPNAMRRNGGRSALLFISNGGRCNSCYRSNSCVWYGY